MHDQRLHRVEVVVDQGGDVPVTPELAQQGLGVPQHQVRWLGPVEAGVGGEQRPALVSLGGPFGRPPGQCGGPSHLR